MTAGVRRAAMWAFPALWCVGVLGLGYGTAERARQAESFRAGRGDLVSALRLYLSKDSDEHVYFEYAGLAVGDARADTAYLAEQLQRPVSDYPETDGSPALPYVDFPVEYPPLSMAFLVLPRLVAPDLDSYRHAYGLLATLALYVLLISAVRTARRSLPDVPGRVIETRVLAMAAVASFFTGALVVTRLDIFPAALVMLGLSSLTAGRPRRAGLFLGLGIGAKVWPVFVVFMGCAWLLGRRRGRDAAWLAVTAVTVAFVIHLPFLVMSPGGVVAAYSYHSARGLQIETLWSSIVMAIHVAGGIDASVGLGHGAYELESSVSAVLSRVPVFAVPLVAAASGMFAWRRVRADAPESHPDMILFGATLGMTAALLCSAHVLSPQYVIWLFPLGLVIGARDRRIAVAFMSMLVLNAVLYPHLYFLLRRMHPAMVAVLLARNGLLVAIAGMSFKVAIRTRPSRAS